MCGMRAVVRHYLPDLVFGANDGIITTFAVVSGVVGASLSNRIILILGFANLVADGVSMGRATISPVARRPMPWRTRRGDWSYATALRPSWASLWRGSFPSLPISFPCRTMRDTGWR